VNDERNFESEEAKDDETEEGDVEGHYWLKHDDAEPPEEERD